MNGQRVIALGFFDGVHVGHAALLQTARCRADALGCAAVGLTFDPHPDTLVRGEHTPLLNTLQERRLLMTEYYGMDDMLVLPFDRAMMQRPWESFVTDVLAEQLQAVHVVCGADYTFGSRGAGNARSLQTLCQKLGLGCDIVDKVELLGAEVSSTRIRGLLERGELETANTLLGHRHFFLGEVVHGRKLGRKLGCPTANLLLPETQLAPKYGVYAAQVLLPDGQKKMAVTNIGSRPTVGGEGVTVESWLLDYQGELYGEKIQVQLCKFLRPERKFSDLQALQEAMQQDAAAARACLEEI